MRYSATPSDTCPNSRLAEFDARLRLARASELACHGHLLEAERLLCGGGVSQATAEELDLLARIHVQQGRFGDAKRRWESAIERGGDRRAQYQDCLRVLEEFSAQVMKRRIVEWRISVGLFAASCLVACWMLIAWVIQTYG